VVFSPQLYADERRKIKQKAGEGRKNAYLAATTGPLEQQKGDGLFESIFASMNRVHRRPCRHFRVIKALPNSLVRAKLEKFVIAT
jgi:hypothetical protein